MKNMKRSLLFFFVISAIMSIRVLAQDQSLGPGIGIYPTGTETGFGFRSSKNKHWALDLRVTKANLFTNPGAGSLVNEASFIYRIAYYEKVRFHVGLGGRADWSGDKNQSHKFGFVAPVGVEAFPFSFQNAGLFFEAAPFCTWMNGGNSNIGLRTVAGFVFYFVKGEKKK
jgi:hypothetical protein